MRCLVGLILSNAIVSPSKSSIPQCANQAYRPAWVILLRKLSCITNTSIRRESVVTLTIFYGCQGRSRHRSPWPWVHLKAVVADPSSRMCVCSCGMHPSRLYLYYADFMCNFPRSCLDLAAMRKTVGLSRPVLFSSGHMSYTQRSCRISLMRFLER